MQDQKSLLRAAVICVDDVFGQLSQSLGWHSIDMKPTLVQKKTSFSFISNFQ